MVTVSGAADASTVQISVPQMWLEATWPRTCAGCARPGQQWCSACTWWLHNRHAALAPPIPNGPPLLAVGGEYIDKLRAAVLLFKQRSQRQLRHSLIRLAAEGVALVRLALAALGRTEPLLLVPFPSSQRRPWRVPTHEIAQPVAAHCVALTWAPVLSTARRRSPQKGLDRAARARNVLGSMRVQGRPMAGAVLLFDDVLTTGATIIEAARTLAHVGMSVVGAVALAQAPPGRTL